MLVPERLIALSNSNRGNCRLRLNSRLAAPSRHARGCEPVEWPAATPRGGGEARPASDRQIRLCGDRRAGQSAHAHAG